MKKLLGVKDGWKRKEILKETVIIWIGFWRLLLRIGGDFCKYQ